MPHFKAAGFALAALVTANVMPALASEYCVTCTSPAVNYRCMTDDGRSGAGSDQRAWLQCASEIAKSKGHGSCSIDRKTTAPCQGQVHNVTSAGLGPAPQPADTPSAAPAAANANTTPPLPDLVDNTGAKSQAGTPEPAAPAAPPEESSGNAIGNAAQKTWDCMSSLFKKC